MGALKLLYEIRNSRRFSPSRKNYDPATSDQIANFAKYLQMVLYSNPFWDDNLNVLTDRKSVELVGYQLSLPPKNRNGSLIYYVVILWAQIMSAMLLTSLMDVDSSDAKFGFAVWVFLGCCVLYDAAWMVLIVQRWILKFRSSNKIIYYETGIRKRSNTKYQKWLSDLKVTEFSKFVEIQKWHQQESLLDESKKQTQALNMVARAASITAINTQVIRNNQANPNKFF
jgi:hypothetical protein